MYNIFVQLNGLEKCWTKWTGQENQVTNVDLFESVWSYVIYYIILNLQQSSHSLYFAWEMLAH